MSDVLLIPSAILVPNELRLDLGKIPTGMIPLHGKPMVYHISSNYDDVTTYVAYDAADNTIPDYIDREGLGWNTVPVEETSSLGDTVAQSLDWVLNRERIDGSNVYVNFADTYVRPTQETELNDFASYATMENSVRWTTFEKRDGEIVGMSEKLTPTIGEDTNVFTGAFGISDPAAYGEELEKALKVSRPLDPFYRALASYFSGRNYELIQCEEWIDVGHLDTYYDAKQQFLNVREFNEVAVDGRRSVIEKRSDRIETLANEYEWYKQIPDALKPYLPRIYNFSAEEGTLTMEYVGYPSLRDIHLYGSHGLHIWNQIFSTLFSMLENFRSYTVRDGIESALKKMYVEKTERRLADVNRTGALAQFFTETVEINGVERPGVPRVLGILEEELRSHKVFDVGRFPIIHGDLCFSNILFDIRSSGVKLIDPRGKFGKHIAYGDQHYDLAKLRHSVAGNYDFVINDLFDICVDATGSVTYEVYTDGRHHERKRLFDDLLQYYMGDATHKVKLVESLLFLSMVPLHDDGRDRQQYMLAYGLEAFDKVVNL
jgi:hypothetical protein